MRTPETPHFIKVRGCINCSGSKSMKEKTGHDYGFDHEIMAGCLIMGCHYYGVTILNPYFDPEEVASKIQEIVNTGNTDIKTVAVNALRFCRHMQKEFGKFYDAEGIPISQMVKRLAELPKQRSK